MKKLIIAFSLLFVCSSAWAGTKTIETFAGSKNWNDTAAWVGGVIPVANDDVVATATSGDVTVNVNTVNLKSFDLTGYTHTLSGTSAISVISAVSTTATCKFAGTITWTGTLNLNPFGAASVIQFTSGTLAPNIISVNGATTGTVTLTGDTTFASVTTAALNILSAGTFDMNGHTINGHAAPYRLFIKTSDYANVLAGNQRIITVNGGSFTYADFQDILFNNGGADLNLSGGTLSGDCGNNGMSGGGSLSMTISSTQTMTTSSSQTWSTAPWTSRVPLCQDDVSLSGVTGGTISTNMPRVGKNIDWTGSSGTITWASGGAYVAGGINLTGITTFTSGVWYYMGRGNHAIFMNGKSMGSDTYWYAPGATYTMTGNWTGPNSAQFKLAQGTVISNGYTMQAGGFLLSAGTVFNISNSTCTIPAGANQLWIGGGMIISSNSTINDNYSTASAHSFVGGGNTYNIVNFPATAGSILTITGNNTFGTLNLNAPRTYKFTDGTTTTVGTLNANGTAGNMNTLTGTSTGGWNIYSTSGLYDLSYVNLSYSRASGGATWQAYYWNGNNDLGNNVGWFTAYPNKLGDGKWGDGVFK